MQAAHIQAYYTKMLDVKKLSKTSVLYHHRILHEALRYAVNLGYIPFNPCDRVKPPSKNKPEMKPLTDEQANYVLKNCKEEKAYLAIMLALQTGMRLGEICGLCWKEVDLVNNTIRVTHSLQRQDKLLKLKEPKTKKSRRSIPITADVVKELKTAEQRREEDKKAAGKKYDKRDFVCAWEDGRPFDPTWVSEQWRLIIAKDKARAEKKNTERFIPDGVRFHDLRHTHASILLNQHISMKVVQERLGHESMATTADIYSHLSPSTQQTAVTALNNVYGS